MSRIVAVRRWPCLFLFVARDSLTYHGGVGGDINASVLANCEV